jgi:hypothetical protein
MFAIETFFSMLLVKCKTRGEQIALIIGMLVLIAACYGIGKFFLGLGQAGTATMQEAVEMDLQAGSVADIGHITFYGYAGAAISGLVGLLFALIALINTVRFLTGTGLADPNESW